MDLMKLGFKLTKMFTIPIILFFIGVFTLPWGVVFWIIGFIIFVGALAN